MKIFNSYQACFYWAAQALRWSGAFFKSEKWQGVTTPELMFETFFLSFRIQMGEVDSVVSRPWVDLHFAERVGGQPTNPGETYTAWPYYKSDQHRAHGVFTHTYQERIWSPTLNGIRYPYGNLGDVVKLLQEQPGTRQAYLPIWFPEDTGVVHGGRVPCSIGYHFMIRNGFMHITYNLRSCDLRRHFNDDMYLATKLATWMIQQVDGDLQPGFLVVTIDNLHVFQSDMAWLNKMKYNESIGNN